MCYYDGKVLAFWRDFMKQLRTLIVLSGILDDPLIRAFFEGDRTLFLRHLYRSGTEEHFAARLADAVLTDPNPFSCACAAGRTPSGFVRSAYLSDLKTIACVIDETPEDGFAYGKTPLPVGEWDDNSVFRLEKYYASHGYGAWIGHTAFRYSASDRTLQPIRTPSSVTLSDLKGYESEKAEVRDNFENFVLGLPYADMLLYGDRGTGKSSTVHAMVNAFADRKLRLVEMDKENILELPRLRAMLADEPMKFVVFIDDFSLREEDDRVSTLKAALQGSMEGHAGNVMIVATSNRRHIVEENFATRRDSVHAGDSEEELLSLSDRFGITVLFASTDKKQYLSIVRALATEAALHTDPEQLDLLAERWALLRGGRSPRRARQFIGYLIACERKGRPAQF